MGIGGKNVAELVPLEFDSGTIFEKRLNFSRHMIFVEGSRGLLQYALENRDERGHCHAGH